ncbi:unnamed protein product [Rotaria sordida]|uniref:Tetratricopeptide repeat protein n=2 Tax=Rotaria sordida TaxID=392033 RepID=A0A815HNE9_9BILA|nr:unnamed protein product [Rotaria sordida]
MESSNLFGILFVMKIDPCIPSTPFADVRDISYFEGEEEILFSMHSIFRIGQMKQIDGNNRFWQVDLTLTSDNDLELHALTEHMRKETYPEEKGWNRLGMLLIKLGQFDKAQEVYNVLLEQTTTDRKKSLIYHQLGWVKKRQGQYEHALVYYKQSIEIKEKTLSPMNTTLAASYTGIGLVYGNIGDYLNALSSHQKALEIYQKTLPSNHPHLTVIYNNIGMVYNKMNDYLNALSYHQQALEIKQKSLPSNHPDFAPTYGHIGMVSSKIREHSKAVSYCERALKILENSLPANHLHIQFFRNNLDYVKKKL